MNPNLASNLLSILPIKTCRFHLKEEAAIQREFVQFCTTLTLQNRLKAVWTSIANENSNNKHPVFGSMLKSLGKIKGAPDMVFLWKDGCGFIEFKSPKGKLSTNQKVFKDWCGSLQVKYKLARSCVEATEILVEWGVLK